MKNEDVLAIAATLFSGIAPVIGRGQGHHFYADDKGKLFDECIALVLEREAKLYEAIREGHGEPKSMVEFFR